MFSEDDLLGPFERVGVVIIGSDEGVDLIADLARGCEAGPGQGVSGEDGEPHFHLVEPGGVGRREVKLDVLVARQPAIVLGLMGVQVVQDDVNFSAGMFGDDAVHEVQKLDSPTAPVMAGSDLAGGHRQGREQRCCSMAFVLMVEAGERLAVGQLQPALGALQSLNVRLFIDRQDHGVLRRLQVERDEVGGLLRERY